MSAVANPQQAKLVLLGDMGTGKSSLVLRYVRGQFFDYQVFLTLDISIWPVSHFPDITLITYPIFSIQ